MKEYLNDKGQFHRIDGPAVENENGDKEWYYNGKLHRLDGPAKEHVNGDKQYWLNNELHRIDGPAIDFANGRYQRYYLNGVNYTFDEWDRLRKLLMFT